MLLLFEPYNLDNSIALFHDGQKTAQGTRMITNNLERRALQITLQESIDLGLKEFYVAYSGGNPTI